MLGRALRNAFEKRRKGKSKTSVVSVLAKPVLYSWTSCPCWDDPSIENLAYTASLCLGVSWERFVNPDYYIVPHRFTPIWQSWYNAISSPATWVAKGNWYGRCIHLLFPRYLVSSASAPCLGVQNRLILPNPLGFCSATDWWKLEMMDFVMSDMMGL